MSALFHWASVLPEKLVLLAKANFTVTTPPEKTSLDQHEFSMVSVGLKLV